MDMLKKLFPFAFTEKKDVASLVLYAIVHIFAMAVISVVSFLIGLIPIIALIAGLIFGLIDLYLFVSLVLCFLDFFKILEKEI